MKTVNPVEYQAWKDNNIDEYGKEIFEYAERWADLMEIAMADGAIIEDIAEKTSHEANINSISGFMYGAALSVLGICWEHGKELKMWNINKH